MGHGGHGEGSWRGSDEMKVTASRTAVLPQ